MTKLQSVKEIKDFQKKFNKRYKVDFENLKKAQESQFRQVVMSYFGMHKHTTKDDLLLFIKENAYYNYELFAGWLGTINIHQLTRWYKYNLGGL